MSSFKNFAPLLTSLQAQADGTGTIEGSPLEDFLSIAGYETPGGGGGGGDLSIANLTLINNRSENVSCTICQCDEEYGTTIYGGIEANGTAELLVPLYKGKADIIFSNTSLTFILDGDITGESGYYTATGDCSITVSA